MIRLRRGSNLAEHYAIVDSICLELDDGTYSYHVDGDYMIFTFYNPEDEVFIKLKHKYDEPQVYTKTGTNSMGPR